MKFDRKKKLIVTALCMMAPIWGISHVSAAETNQAHASSREVKVEESRTAVIPYPEGLDTTSSGASSVPKEINHADSIYFKDNDYFNMGNSKNRIMLTYYPTYQQTTEYTCGPAAALTVLYYYGNHAYDEMRLAKIMKTNDKIPVTTSRMAMRWKTGRNFIPCGLTIQCCRKRSVISHG